MEQIKLRSKFDQFRKDNLFIDCILVDQKYFAEKIKAHRLVLSNYSTVFREYFKTHSFIQSNNHVPIPLNTENNFFPKVIDFMYTNSFQFDINTCMEFFVLSIAYEIVSLVNLVKEQLAFNGAIRVDTVLIFLKQLISFEVYPEISSQFPGLNQNVEDLFNEASCFTDFVADNFLKFNVNDIYKSSTARTLSMILSKAHIPDIEKIKIINDFVGLERVSEADSRYLTRVINWKDNCLDCLDYLVKYSCDWVHPSESRPLYGLILEQRLKTLFAFKETAYKISKETANSWYTSAWIGNVMDSHGDQTLKEIELSEYMGTFGGIVPYYNPARYGFCEILSLPPISSYLFSELSVFDNDDKYYLSSSIKNRKTSYIGIKLAKPFFNLSSILVNFDSPGRGKSISEEKKLQYDPPGKFKCAVMHDPNQPVVFNQFVVDGEMFNVLGQPENDGRPIKTVVLKHNTEDRVKCMRVTRLKLWGTFSY